MRNRSPSTAIGVIPETNIVPIEVADAPATAAAARDEGVLISVVGPRKIRAVTHLDIDDDGAKKAADLLARLLG